MPRIDRGGAEGGFEVSLAQGSRLVRAVLRGAWDVTMAEEFGLALATAATTLGMAPWAVFCDSRNFHVQSPEVTQIRQRVMTNIRTRGCVKVALIAASAVYKMQFNRIAVESHMGTAIFSDEKTALAWLQGAVVPSSK